MFTTIQPHEIKDNKHLMDAVHRLRKKVFYHQLGWDVPVVGDYEIDAYDNLGATYLVWCSHDRKELYGTLRLMTSEGPTLMFDVFSETHGSNQDLIHPACFEGTRMCIDEEAIARDFPDMPAGHAFSLMILALCEASMAHGIKRLLSNYEPCMSRVYRRAGIKCNVHGHADIYGKRPVYCSSFDVNKTVLATIREKIGVDLPVFDRSSDFVQLVKDDAVPQLLQAA